MSNSERIVKGILGTKLGMTQLWDENNKIVPVTVIQAGPCVVTQVRTPEKDGYSAVQLGFGAIASRKVTKPAQGHFDKAGVTPRRHLLELRTANASEFTLGQELTAELFAGGEFVDVTGTTKGKGTAGVMKRHGFGGLKGSHGVHRKHRAPGSIGGCSTPRRGVDRGTEREKPPRTQRGEPNPFPLRTITQVRQQLPFSLNLKRKSRRRNLSTFLPVRSTVCWSRTTVTALWYWMLHAISVI